MSRSERVYRALLLAYPKEFRREYGSQMEQAFGDLYREARERGGKSGIARLWMLTIPDLARTAVAQRITARADREEVAMYDRKLAVVGTLLLLAPLYFVTASLLKYGPGDRVSVRSSGDLSLRRRSAGRIQRGLAVRFLRWIEPRACAEHLRRGTVERESRRRNDREYRQAQAEFVEHLGRRREHPVTGDAPRLRIPRKLHPPLESDSQ